MDDPNLKYQFLAHFDRDMIAFVRRHDILKHGLLKLIHENSGDKVIAFERAGILFVFNFHDSRSHVDYPVKVSLNQYRLLFDTDRPEYGGYNRLLPGQHYIAIQKKNDKANSYLIRLYLPTRTALVLIP